MARGRLASLVLLVALAACGGGEGGSPRPGAGDGAGGTGGTGGATCTVAAVDEFVTRLDDFVASAGDKLYAGISEVLDKAIAERRAHGDGVQAAAAEAEAQIAGITAVEARLGELRAGLWKTTP
jgi:hypothetical protein